LTLPWKATSIIRRSAFQFKRF